MSSPTGRRALITGGSSGIGLAVGRQLVERSYEVVLNARRTGPLEAAADEIGAAWAAGDCADVDDVRAVCDSAGPVDLLVHAAGVMQGTFVRKESVETFDAVVRANLRSAFLVTHAVLPTMSAGGRIVFLSSSSAHVPQPGKAAYSASKAGLNAFALALAGEVERDGISVHVVTPAPVATPMLDDVHFAMHALDPEQVADAVVWLDTLDPSVVLPELELRATNVGPFAPEPFVPEAAREARPHHSRSCQLMIVNHVGLRVSDIERSTRFYGCLGFTERMAMDVPDEATSQLLQVSAPVGLRAAYLVNGSFVLELLAYEHHPSEPVDRAMTDTGLTHLSIGVDDVAAAKASVVEHGGEVVETSDVGVAVMVRDPDGQLIELLDVQYRPVSP